MNGKVWRKLSLGVFAGVLLGAIAVASSPNVATADNAPACGSKENPCPLQKWMRQNMGAANSAGDMAALRAAFDKVAGIAPDPAWNNGDPKTTWKGIAAAGSAAAKAGDAAGVKSACKSCHEAFKEKYKTSFRTKPAP